MDDDMRWDEERGWWANRLAAPHLWEKDIMKPEELEELEIAFQTEPFQDVYNEVHDKILEEAVLDIDKHLERITGNDDWVSGYRAGLKDAINMIRNKKEKQ